MNNLSSHINIYNTQQEHYLIILRHITKYFQNQFTWNKGKPNQTSYSLMPYIFGGFIRDIIKGKDKSNDCDIFIKTTNKSICLSLKKFRECIIYLNRYLTKELPDIYEVIEQEYPLNEHYKVFETYGHYKVIVKNNENNEIYTFDISTQINNFDEMHITNMFTNLVDYTINNLMCSVCLIQSEKLLFGNLELRVKEITTYLKKKYSVDEIIHHILSGIAIEYDYIDFINKYSDNFCIKQKEEIETKMLSSAKERRDKLIRNEWILQL
jgi:hypothetical protein